MIDIKQLGLPEAINKHDEALQQYCLDVMKTVERLVVGEPSTHKETGAIIAAKIFPAREWIALQQAQAFENGASVDECAKWIVKNLNDPRIKT